MAAGLRLVAESTCAMFAAAAHAEQDVEGAVTTASRLRPGQKMAVAVAGGSNTADADGYDGFEVVEVLSAAQAAEDQVGW